MRQQHLQKPTQRKGGRLVEFLRYSFLRLVLLLLLIFTTVYHYFMHSFIYIANIIGASFWLCKRVRVCVCNGSSAGASFCTNHSVLLHFCNNGILLAVRKVNKLMCRDTRIWIIAVCANKFNIHYTCFLPVYGKFMGKNNLKWKIYA